MTGVNLPHPAPDSEAQASPQEFLQGIRCGDLRTSLAFSEPGKRIGVLDGYGPSLNGDNPLRFP